jgi:hypothetical protein
VSSVEASLPDHISEIVDVWLNEEMEDFGDPMENTVTAMDCAICADSYGLHPTFSYLRSK